MPRILYWNINNFSQPKIWNTAGGVLTFRANDRRNYIVNQVMAAPAAGGAPDVIIVVEVHSRVREVRTEGTVLLETRGAGLGVLRLLATIRAHAALGPAWCLVPPLYLGEWGQSECVAVFYNSANLQFIGPNILCNLYPLGVQVGWGQPVNVFTYNHRLNYSAAWRAAQPVGLARTHNFTINGVVTPVPEIQMAGEWQYYTTPPARPVPSPVPPPYAPNRLFFPHVGSRGPFWTRFLDLGGGPELNLFTVHTSPASASAAILQMQNIAAMTAVAPAEVNVILGDFNVDSFGALAFATYGWMDAVAGGGIYDMALDPRNPATGVTDPLRKRYCMTHFLGPANATPFNTVGGFGPDPQHNHYPRYGYMGESWPAVNDTGAIDNFFTAYGFGAGGPAANITAVNTVVGTPYNVYPAPGPGVTAELRNGLQYGSTLANLIPLGAAPGGVNPPVCNINFPAWQNFSRIYRTSDHLPLMIDV